MVKFASGYEGWPFFHSSCPAVYALRPAESNESLADISGNTLISTSEYDLARRMAGSSNIFDGSIVLIAPASFSSEVKTLLLKRESTYELISIAPKSGEESRKELKDAAVKLYEENSPAINEAKKQALENIDLMKYKLERQLRKFNNMIKSKKLLKAKELEELDDDFGY